MALKDLRGPQTVTDWVGFIFSLVVFGMLGWGFLGGWLGALGAMALGTAVVLYMLN